jgi:tetratricopeptide (TPR) repeat protein
MKSPAKFAFALLAVLLFVPAYVSTAAEPGREHPAYLHALTDLRAARANLQRPDGGELREQEKKAIHEIEDAIAEIKKAAIEDGKDINEHPPVDAHLEWGGRLRQALELLDKAHNDVARDEDNGFAQGLQQRALEHIDKAHRHVKEAIEIVR